MKKASPTSRRKASEGVVLGLRAFEKISAVEGIKISDELKHDLETLEAGGTSDAARTRFIVTKYGNTLA